MPLLSNLAVRDIETLVHPYTHLAALRETGPLILERGKGVFVYDNQGKGYIEGMAGLWCTALGYGNEELVEAAAAQMRKLPFAHLFTGKSHDAAIELAERLKDMVPVAASKVLFCSSGSEANDTQVKLVWYMNNALGRPRKKKIISRLRAYHGVTIAAASLTGLVNNHRDFDLPIAGILHMGCPHHYRFAHAGEGEEDFARRLAAELEELILKEDPETVAAFIAEPVMGAGGVIPPPPTYFPRVREICDRHNVLLIADEVITGFGRTGRWFALGHWNVEPDLVSFAKGVTSAYLPLGGVLASKRVHDAVQEAPPDKKFMHAATYSGHPTCCAVALRNLEVLQHEGLIERAGPMGRRLLAGLETLRDLEPVGDVRGLGMMCGVELVSDRKTKTPALGLGGRVVQEARSRGLLARIRVGSADPPIGDTICIAPPLMTPEETLDRVVEILRAAIIAATR